MASNPTPCHIEGLSIRDANGVSRCETVADIVAQMRGRGEDGRMDRRLWLDYADRIEAAWKRERANVEADALEAGGIVEAERNAEKSSEVGNVAAMREAMVRLRDEELHLLETNVRHGIGLTAFGLNQACQIIRDLIEAALSAPPRNCDVGTAEEQAERMRLYCNSHGEDESGCFRCEECPFLTDERCELTWAQLPYDAKEGAAR